MSKKIVVATQKPFHPVAVKKIEEACNKVGYEFKLFANYETQEENESNLLRSLILKTKLMYYWGFYEEAYRFSNRAILEGERLDLPFFVLDVFNEKMDILWMQYYLEIDLSCQAGYKDK